MNALRQELKNDPLNVGYPGMTDAEVEASLLAKDRHVVVGVTRDKFAIWAAKTGVRSTIEDVSLDTQDPLRASALTLLDFIRGGVSTTLELTNADNLQMLGAWVAMGKITEAQKDELIALGTVTMSRAEELGLSVAASAIRDARG